MRTQKGCAPQSLFQHQSANPSLRLTLIIPSRETTEIKSPESAIGRRDSPADSKSRERI